MLAISSHRISSIFLERKEDEEYLEYISELAAQLNQEDELWERDAFLASYTDAVEDALEDGYRFGVRTPDTPPSCCEVADSPAPSEVIIIAIMELFSCLKLTHQYSSQRCEQ